MLVYHLKFFVRDAMKYVETLGEDVASNDEGIFLGCSINSIVYTMFNKPIKSMMEFIKIFVNDFQIEVTPHFDLTSHKVE